MQNMFVVLLNNHNYRIEDWFTYTKRYDDIIQKKCKTYEEAKEVLERCVGNVKMFANILKMIEEGE